MKLLAAVGCAHIKLTPIQPDDPASAPLELSSTPASTRVSIFERTRVGILESMHSAVLEATAAAAPAMPPLAQQPTTHQNTHQQTNVVLPPGKQDILAYNNATPVCFSFHHVHMHVYMHVHMHMHMHIHMHMHMHIRIRITSLCALPILSGFVSGIITIDSEVSESGSLGSEEEEEEDYVEGIVSQFSSSVSLLENLVSFFISFFHVFPLGMKMKMKVTA